MMMPKRTSSLLSLILFLSLFSINGFAEDRPVTGKQVPAFEPVDKAVQDFMDLVGAQAATVAISNNGKLQYSRGYGWKDESRTKATSPTTLMRIASISKPITAAAIKAAFRKNQLSLDEKAFKLLDLEPAQGEVKDPRIWDITIRHLLEHKGGWDRDRAFDPMFQTRRIRRELQLSQPVTSTDVIRWMMDQPLQFAPGEKQAYSNFGYCVLGRVLEKTLNKPYQECIRELVLEPLEIEDIKLGHNDQEERDPREVWYPVRENAFSLDIMDAHGGLIASAPALCQFLEAYWITGEPRRPGELANWYFFGSLPGTTAMVAQYPDGTNVAVLFNARRDVSINADLQMLRKSFDQAIRQANQAN